SFDYRLTADTPVNASSVATVSVFLQSPAWTKPLATETIRTLERDGTFESLQGSYDVNVSNITDLAAQIEKQTGYAPSAYSLVIAPSIRSSVGLGETATGISFFPQLTLNFTADQIKPSALSSTTSGKFIPPGDPPAPGKSDVSVVAFLLMFGSVGGVGALGYYAYATRDERREPDLAAITRPYTEAIVDARAPPSAVSLVPVRAWEDVVKAADTLGSPIIRVVRPTVGESDDAVTTSFYVVSGSSAFVFVHGAHTPPGVSPPPELTARPPAAGGPPKDLSTAVREWHERYPRIPGINSSNLDSFVEWSDRISDRLRWFRPSSAMRQDSEELLLRAIGLAQRGRLDAAWVILGQLHARLGPWDSPAKPGPMTPSPARAPAPSPSAASSKSPNAKP
ncbi:MAG TPA: DUF5305 family protein, partial [Thermoplasmata archaeon]|nr:DUF5305 family protein [Thermoplasmata archaeon]